MEKNNDTRRILFLKNSKFSSKFSSKIKNNNLRYNDWHYRNGSEPAFLDVTDIKKIESEKLLFRSKNRS